MTTGERAAVLYVDDERNNLRVFQYVFAGRFPMRTVSSGAEALELLARERVGVLLTDLRMPGMDGLELCECVRRLYPDIVRMVVTAYSGTAAAREALESGRVSHFIEKPFDSEALATLLLEGLERFVRCGK